MRAEGVRIWIYVTFDECVKFRMWNFPCWTNSSHYENKGYWYKTTVNDPAREAEQSEGFNYGDSRAIAGALREAIAEAIGHAKNGE